MCLRAVVFVRGSLKKLLVQKEKMIIFNIPVGFFDD
jgi:hypothetical protein